MILGCFAGRDALAAAERAMFCKGELDPAFVWELGAALSIAPHDLLPLSLRSLLREDDPLLRAMAIDVLGYRNLATREELTRATSDEPVVAARALVHLAISFGVIEDASIDRALASEDAELREAALCAVALHGDTRGLQRLSAALDGPSADVAALYLAIAGDEHDAQQLLHRTRQTPSRALVEALGWAGAASATGTLFELLEHERSELRLAAAWALERITGAGLWEDAEVPAEDIDVHEPATPDVGEAPVPKLAKIISDPRDQPDKPAMDIVEQPTTRVARWRAYWQEHATKYDLRRRYRMGHPYTPLVSLRELDAERRTPSERRVLQRELIMRTGVVVRLDPRDLVQVQEQAVRDWQGPARAASNTPGAWVRKSRL
jgi:HEAT repeat protein